MNSRDAIKFRFAIALVAIPAVVHAVFEGSYVINPGKDHQTFWIGPISTTIPYLFLALLFLAHCDLLKSKPRRSAYCGAIMAWLGMMAFTTFLICQTPGPKMSSTMGIAVGLTPFCYIPFLFVPYTGGTIGGALWTKWKGRSSPDR